MGMVVIMEHLLRELSTPLANERISPIVLKGAALADGFYPDRSWRAYGDLDLLIQGEEFPRASAVLAVLGFTRLLPEPRSGFDQRFGKGASFEDSHGRQVDLHRTLALGPFGLWIDTTELTRGRTEVELAGARVHRLDDTSTMIHACVHAALGQRETLIVPLRDVLQVAWSGRVDWDLARERIGAWRLAAPVAHALLTARERLSVPIPEEALSLVDLPAGWIERRALASYTTARRDRGGPSVSALWAIPGVSARVAYLRAMLFPDRRFREARGGRSATVGGRLMMPFRWVVARSRGKPPTRGRA